MKGCPTCNRTYSDDTLAFCLIDGAVLSASYEPEQTQRIPPTRTTHPPATEVISDPGRATGSGPAYQATITTPPPALYSPRPPSATLAAPKRSLAPWLIVGGAILFVGILGIAMLAWKFSGATDSSHGAESSPTSRNRPSSSPASTVAETKSACGSAVSAAIYDKWNSAGGESGTFGCPKTNEADAGLSPQGTTGRWIQFARGDGVYLIEHKSGRYAGRVFEVSGCMYKLYGSLGGTRSWLGFPVSDEYGHDPGVRQDFEGGYTVWDRKTYVCEAKKN